MKEQPSYYAILTADVRYDKELSSSEKIFFAEITALSQKNGECWASNSYFSDLYGVGNSTVSGWVSKLSSKGYISVEYQRAGKQIERRIIRIRNSEGVFGKLEGGIQISEGGYSENPKGNNTSINNTSEYTSNLVSVREWMESVPNDHSTGVSWRFFAKNCMGQGFPIKASQVKSRAHQFCEYQEKINENPQKTLKDWNNYYLNWVKKQRFKDESGY